MTLVISPSGVRFQKEVMTTQTQTWLNEMVFAPQSQLLDDITLIHMQGIQSMHLNRMQFYTHFITVLPLNGKSIKAAAGNNPAPKRINQPKIKNSAIFTPHPHVFQTHSLSVEEKCIIFA